MKKQRIELNVIDLVYILILFVCFSFWWIGFHNIDNSYNMLKISYDEGLDVYYSYVEHTAETQTLSYFNLYLLGMSLMQTSVTILVLTSIVYVFCKSKLSGGKK